MTAELYQKTTVQNPNTGQVKAEYVSNGGFTLIARGLANLRGKDSGTLQDYGNKLDQYHYLRVKTMRLMEEGDVIAGITDSNDQPYLNHEIQFIVLGVTPTYDPFGSFLEYDIICNRADVPIKIATAIVGSDETVIEDAS